MPAKVGYLVIDAAEPERLASFWCAATAEVEELGGRWLEPGNTREREGFRWRSMPIRRATSSTSTSCPPMRS
jgi:hypothetical protein